MNIPADENVEAAIVAQLRGQGHIVNFVLETDPGIPDTQVLQMAIDANSILLTGDKDFGDLIFFQRYQAPAGVVLLRLPDSLTSQEKSEIVGEVLHKYESQCTGAFMVITPSNVRITRFRPHLP